MPNTPMTNDAVIALKEEIKKREAKIEDVKQRIVRQTEHITQTQKKKERFEAHLERWERQNNRDRIKLADNAGTPIVG